jgi:threonine synthase
MRRMGKHPDVYIQALSGGTGPFAIEKAHKEMQGTGLFDKLPRFILSQPSGCDPMTQSWEKAKANGFPEGFEKEYTIIDNPVTLIPTLATGHPATYPAMAKLVQKSNGEILTFDENRAADVTRLVAYETGVKIGPASAIAFGGLLEAFKKGMIKQGESILINLGEGTLRATEYMQAMAYTTKEVHSVDECEKFDRAIYKETVWAPFL